MFNKKSKKKTFTSGFTIQDFFVDFLGGLVPGTLLIIGFVAAISAPLFAFINSLNNQTSDSLGLFTTGFLEKTRGTPSALWIGAIGALVCFSYVIGHLFYRRDPKNPDKKSLMKIKKKLKLSDEQSKNELACKDANDCEFPYPYMDKYLEQRGLSHLNWFVVWNEDLLKRSKIYINILKVRLRFYHPEKCGVIIRNEAHVRLASSAWYSALFLRASALISLFVLLFAIIYFDISNDNYGFAGSVIYHFQSMIPPLLVLGLTEFTRLKVERFLHYQRLREVIYVLETAYTAFRDNPELLNPPFDLNDKRILKKMNKDPEG